MLCEHHVKMVIAIMKVSLMNSKTLPIFAFIGAMATQTAIHADEIYKWVDEAGRIHYGEAKPEAIIDAETININYTSTAPTRTYGEDLERLRELTRELAAERRAREQSRLEQERLALERDKLRLREAYYYGYYDAGYYGYYDTDYYGYYDAGCYGYRDADYYGYYDAGYYGYYDADYYGYYSNQSRKSRYLRRGYAYDRKSSVSFRYSTHKGNTRFKLGLDYGSGRDYHRHHRSGRALDRSGRGKRARNNRAVRYHSRRDGVQSRRASSRRGTVGLRPAAIQSRAARSLQASSRARR